MGYLVSLTCVSPAGGGGPSSPSSIWFSLKSPRCPSVPPTSFPGGNEYAAALRRAPPATPAPVRSATRQPRTRRTTRNAQGTAWIHLGPLRGPPLSAGGRKFAAPRSSGLLFLFEAKPRVGPHENQTRHDKRGDARPETAETMRRRGDFSVDSHLRPPPRPAFAGKNMQGGRSEEHTS